MKPQKVRTPGYVRDELVKVYGAEAPQHRHRGRQAQRAVGPAVIGRAERWVLGTSMACCLAVMAAILIALVAVTPSPAVAVTGLLAILLIAIVAARMVVRALQPDKNDERYGA